MLILVAVFLLAALVCFFVLEEWKQIFFVASFSFLALNATIAYLFAKVNSHDKK